MVKPLDMVSFTNEEKIDIVKRALEKAGSNYKLAKVLGFHSSSVDHWIQGIRKPANSTTVRLLNYIGESLPNIQTAITAQEKKEFEGMTEAESTVLQILRKSKYAVTRDDLLVATNLDKLGLDQTIQSLIMRGYDIKTLSVVGEKSYILVRSTEEGFRYRAQQVINSDVILLTADWHIGSIRFSKLAFDYMVDTVKSMGIKYIISAGDQLQGLGVFRTEAEELAPNMHLIDNQVEYAMFCIEELPADVTVLMCCGTHEEKLKGSHRVGYDMLKHLAVKVPNVSYYGKVLNVEVDPGYGKKYRAMAIHGSGGASYAITYPVQKILRGLYEVPDFLTVGHYHRLDSTTVGRCEAIQPGTFQRESHYSISRGLEECIGFMILELIDDETFRFTKKKPKVY